ncbi:Cu+-exporting ATPase [Aliiroseovarius halocynthiae]|uniref:Copper-translocating P-type ATPase n=1 Tax=Aliiroseovarius halocynthiae TaxID=985055 RepID=A0A545SRJ7_9RHOB|nr:heavy metal translocating P-type ATPase [Aliiroseovarius halocynthiae]TQV67601.1 copper-translocating P-type ATPase [Aliiroseovarius halocynthiae]SMR81620.1 Cu+-exporting ATPase [Aliiroseovarius halocynthiae]
MAALKSLSLELENLSCASCVGRAERALAAVDGVDAAPVNLATETARVSFAAPATTEVLSNALDRAGYPARRDTVVLDVRSMSCAACVGRVERMLKATPGVLDARVNLASERAFVTFLTGSVTPDLLSAKISKAGFPAAPRTDGSSAGPRDKADEARALKRKALLAAALTLPVFVVEMGGHLFPPFHHWVMHNIGQGVSHWLQLILTTIVLFGPGRLFFAKGIPALLRGAPEMNALVALGASAAYLYSVVSVLTPGILPPGTVNVYFEAAAVIVSLILLGRWMEARAKGRTGEAIRALVELAPDEAIVDVDGQQMNRPVAQVITGEVIVIRPGERVPLDAEVIEGESLVDESMITGEPIPVAKAKGSPITGGTVNGTGALKARVTAVGPDTMLAQIVRMVEDAQGARLPIQALVDKITAVFVPVVMAVAALTVAVWLLVGPDPALGLALVAGVSVLIIACPCAMGLATPTSIMVGTGRAAQLGVLFRRGDALQALQSVDVVAFDKTGTLTEGRPKLVAFEVTERQAADTLLSLIAGAEAQSEHPLAQAILSGATGRGLIPAKVSNVQTETGFGLSADAEGTRLLIGSQQYMAREGVALTDLVDRADPMRADGQTVFFAAHDGQLAALIGVADPVKPDTLEALDALRDAGKELAMITGDDPTTAAAIAGQLHLDRVVAGVIPGEKLDTIAQMQGQGLKVAFVGDGINDAPALAQADVGIAIGTGTDVAIEAADVVLSSGALSGVVNALQVSRRTMTNIRQNLFWAFGYNVALVPVAAGVLYPIWGVLLSPMLGAGAMAASSVLVLTNALRLRFIKPTLKEAT